MRTANAHGGPARSYGRPTMISNPSRGISHAVSCARATGGRRRATAIVREAWCPTGPRVHRSGHRAHADGEVSTVLAEVGLPGAVRSQQTGYDVHPALLDACFQSVTAHPAIRDGADDGLLVPLGVHRLRRYGSARNTRYCYARVTGRRVGARGGSRPLGRGRGGPAGRARPADGNRRDRERRPGAGRSAADLLLAATHVATRCPRPPGDWLLIATGHRRDREPIASGTGDGLKSHGAQCR